MDNKPDWCPQDLWDETSSAFDLRYESEPAFKFGFEYEIRSMAAAVAMVAIATERERAAKVCEAVGARLPVAGVRRRPAAWLVRGAVCLHVVC